MKYCAQCVQPDTRPGIRFDEEGVCPACRYVESLAFVDWDARHRELDELLKRTKKDNHSGYDCLIGVSGGKDSTRQALYVRDALGLSPLLVCCAYPPEQMTELGARNLSNLISLGFDTVVISPDPQTWKQLMRKGFLEYGNWAKPTETALYATLPRISIAYHTPLAFLGENPATQMGDLGTGSLNWDANKMKYTNTITQGADIYLGDDIGRKHLLPYVYPSDEEMTWANLQVAYLGYFWPNFTKVDNAAFSMSHGLDIRTDTPGERGALHPYESLDEDFVFVNQMIKYFKFGFGKVTDEVSELIRFGHMSRSDGIALVKKYDGKCAPHYIKRFCDYIELSEDEFWKTAESYRNKDLFENIGGETPRPVLKAPGRRGARSRVWGAPADIEAAQAFILPGVGAFAEAMRNLESRSLIEPLRREVVERGKPLLGICLGMQVLAEDSTENGMNEGLRFIPGHVVRIEEQPGLRIPHVGWSEVTVRQKEPLFSTIAPGTQFYFDHSYHFQTKEEYVAAVAPYGQDITAAVQYKNIYGVQFHPEKSHNNGLRLLRGFLNVALPQYAV